MTLATRTLDAAESAEARSPGPILFLCAGLFSLRNVLHSKIVPSVQAHGHRVCVLGQGAPQGETRDYAELAPPPVRRSAIALTALDVLQHASFYRRHGLSNGRVTHWWYRRNDSRLKRTQHGLVDAIAVLGSRDPFYGWQMATVARLKRSTWDLVPAARQLDAIQPALVVATSCISWLEEPLLLAARERGIPTLGCVQSFDHLTDRSSTADCDYYAVWNERMKTQLIRYHTVRDPSRIHVTGTPQFDFHAQEAFRWSRSNTAQRLGLGPDERYVLYAANTYSQTPTEPELVSQLAARCARTPELRAHRIVVRLHPNDDFSRWEGISAADPRIMVSHPSRERERFAGPEDQARLVSTLLHADVCLNMWSSMSLDAAAVNTPIVCVAFAGHRGGLEDRFARMVYATDFFRPIVESGGVRVAQDMDQLVGETIAYVGDRSRDEPSRRRLAAQECGPLDGRSAERVAALIAKIAASPPGSAGQGSAPSAGAGR